MARPCLWTSDEIQALRENRIPEGRSLHACWTKAHKLGLSFCPGGHPECRNKNLSDEDKKKILEHVRIHRNRTRAAELFGVSRNYVSTLCAENGLKMCPRPHDRLGEHVEYEGHNFSWKKGSWICTSSRVRATGEYNLTRILWKKYYGVYPGPGYDIRYKDGDKYNLTKNNLVLVTKSEAQKIRLKDPFYRAVATASAIMGLLQNNIMETLDPDKKKRRIRKAMESRKPKQGEIIRKAVETRRRRAEERGYYYDDETIQKMRESHKGKTYNRKRKNEK